MPKNPDRVDELEQANEHLQTGLRQCQELVADLRVKLAANLNDPPTDNRDDRPTVVSD